MWRLIQSFLAVVALLLPLLATDGSCTSVSQQSSDQLPEGSSSTSLGVQQLQVFRECQRQFGFTKRQQSYDATTNKKVEVEMGRFYSCLEHTGKACKLLLSLEVNENEEEDMLLKQGSFEQCFVKCYDKRGFKTQIMKNMVDHAMACAEKHLDEVMTQKTLPWELFVGSLIAAVIITGFNLDRLAYLARGKQFKVISREDDVYSLHPEYMKNAQLQKEESERNSSAIVNEWEFSDVQKVKEKMVEQSEEVDEEKQTTDQADGHSISSYGEEFDPFDL